MDPRLDFPRSVPLRASYVVASSYRCGSTYLCAQLWRTGVLGAPAEYLNVGAGRRLRDVMMSRLQATSPDDYIARLLAHRTSRNGVFGLKAHFQHFEEALSWCPSLLSALSPVSYIYLERLDRLAQAISMAKSMQTNRWTSMDPASGTAPYYDETLIRGCLLDLEGQRRGWLRWFERHAVTPLVATYEDLIADPAAVVGRLVARLEAQRDEPETIRPRLTEKQADDVNAEWAERFRRARGPVST